MTEEPNSSRCFSFFPSISETRDLVMLRMKQKQNQSFSLLIPDVFQIPHSLSLDEQNRHLFVADRENSRVLVFDSVSGSFVREIKEFGDRVFAVHYHPEQGEYTIALVVS